MRSRTKFELSEETIVQLFEKAGISGAKEIAPLGAGEFNSVYAVKAGDREYALKVAPVDESLVLTYEKGMIEQEVFYYEVMRNQAQIRVPKVYFVDFSMKAVPAKYFIMEQLQGQTLDGCVFSDEEREKADAALMKMVAKIHAVQGTEGFGYRQTGLEDNWFLAIEKMVLNLIQDCKRLGHGTKNGERLLGYIRTYREILENVPCCLINFDIWPANIFCLEQDEAVKLAWIDPERCLWGDRIADFVCMDFDKMTLAGKKRMVDFYNAASEVKIEGGREEEIRLAVMLGYLGLVMEVEKYARYSWLHKGYWRNVAVCRMLFGNCFATLENLKE